MIDWYKSQFATEPWEDYGESVFPPKGNMGGYENSNHCWHKVFQKGSRLEWYNPINLFDLDSMEGIGYGHGINEEWATSTAIESFASRNAHIIEFVQ